MVLALGPGETWQAQHTPQALLFIWHVGGVIPLEEEPIGEQQHEEFCVEGKSGDKQLAASIPPVCPSVIQMLEQSSQIKQDWAPNAVGSQSLLLLLAELMCAGLQGVPTEGTMQVPDIQASPDTQSSLDVQLPPPEELLEELLEELDDEDDPLEEEEDELLEELLDEDPLEEEATTQFPLGLQICPSRQQMVAPLHKGRPGGQVQRGGVPWRVCPVIGQTQVPLELQICPPVQQVEPHIACPPGQLPEDPLEEELEVVLDKQGQF